jgi:DNA-binding LacI/PurR family transcriptional regulator
VLQPLRDIGRTAVELTLRRIEGQADPPVRLLLPPEILVTGAPTQASVSS